MKYFMEITTTPNPYCPTDLLQGGPTGQKWGGGTIRPSQKEYFIDPAKITLRQRTPTENTGRDSKVGGVIVRNRSDPPPDYQVWSRAEVLAQAKNLGG